MFMIHTSLHMARSREFLKYYGSFAALSTLGLGVGAFRGKNPRLLVPILPLGLVFMYQLDAAYGTLLSRTIADAETILNTDSLKLGLPGGPPTFKSIEEARLARTNSLPASENQP
ncbi:hypothetical protein NHX12_027998 [Muraenolepis orangiensis]|uniref:Plasminogen receptor (KT) n=1 Tax=Muraenolepis orangiensis TaxID=630683 RepID=A0A9Q0EET8_9TELE|nr:hypothetical protein NHX12_027998 [Muraenolepis orangiensis]